MAEVQPLIIVDGFISVPGNTDEIKANAFVQASTSKYESIWVPSSVMRLHDTSPPDEVSIWDGAYRTLAFDSDTEESVFIETLLPRAYIEGQDLQAAIHIASADNSSGMVCFCFEYRKASTGDLFSSTSVIQMDTTLQGDNNQHCRAVDTCITDSKMKRNTVLVGRLYRDATSEKDTYSNDAYLLGFEIRIPVDRIGAAI